MTTSAPVEKVSQPDMLVQFKERYAKLVEENKELAEKMKNNEVVALKLQGAIEALEYYNENPPLPEGETAVDNLDIPGDDITDESPDLTENT